MSCIRFNTSAQRQQLARNAPTIARSDDPVAQFLSPAITASKIARLRQLAGDAHPKIRESAASSHHSPVDVYDALSRDSNAGVRACIAKNESVPCDVLRKLARDPDERVRGFVAINFFAPTDAMQLLADDCSAMVRGLVAWRASLAELDGAPPLEARLIRV